MGLMRARRAALAILLIVLAGCRSKPDEAKPEHDLAELKSRVSAFAGQLASARKAVGATSERAALTCPQATIGSTLRGAAGRVLAAEYDALARFDEAPIEAERPGAERWAFLTSEALRKLPRASELNTVDEATDAVFRVQQIQKTRPFLGVIHPTKRELPRLEGSKFRGGTFEGWIFVFELHTGRLLCQAPVTARSNRLVASQGAAKVEQSMQQDYENEVRRQLDISLRRITRQLTLDL